MQSAPRRQGCGTRRADVEHARDAWSGPRPHLSTSDAGGRLYCLHEKVSDGFEFSFLKIQRALNDSYVTGNPIRRESTRGPTPEGGGWRLASWQLPCADPESCAVCAWLLRSSLFHSLLLFWPAQSVE